MKGKRIKARDKSLVFQSYAYTLLAIFIVVLLLLNSKQLLETNWKNIKLQNVVSYMTSRYHTFTIIVSATISLLLMYVYHRYYFDRLKQRAHRQMLARMILENGWYETSKEKNTSFFVDLPNKSKECITYFPKAYYKMEKGLLNIQIEITMGKYQEQLLHLENKLESGLYCELIDKILYDGFIEYTLLYDTIANRISIEEVHVENGSLQLMKNVYWKFDILPHALICGGTGGGKTYFLLTIIECLYRTNAELYILDPKNADLADLGTVMDNVFSKKEDMIVCIHEFYDGMVARSESMKHMPNYKTGKNYAFLNLEPHFLIFDEYVAFLEMLTAKESAIVLSLLKKIVMLGRQVGYFLILACQRPDAKYLGDGMRDQFNFRVALGRMSELGYGMMFGNDVKKQFFNKPIKGRGYCDVGTSVISEFYTPYIGEDYDFLKTIGELTAQRQSERKACEAKANAHSSLDGMAQAIPSTITPSI